MLNLPISIYEVKVVALGLPDRRLAVLAHELILLPLDLRECRKHHLPGEGIRVKVQLHLDNPIGSLDRVALSVQDRPNVLIHDNRPEEVHIEQNELVFDKAFGRSHLVDIEAELVQTGIHI
jgi:hypothetical protein